MSMEEAIRNFNTQFAFEPEVIHGDKLAAAQRFVVGGMGGSGHSADLLKGREPTLDVHVHRNYGIPVLPDGLYSEHSFIASSYSGNTEECVDFAHKVFEKGYSVGGISTGGKLLSFLQDNDLPHIVIPDTGIEPRSASGFSIVAMAKMMGQDHLLEELRALEHRLKPSIYHSGGEEITKNLKDRVPVIYASDRNRSIANNWKIKFNETGKMPAYYDVFPELNHNEINGFDYVQENEHLVKQFYFIFITDTEDHERVQKRMQVTQEMYTERNLPVMSISLEGDMRLERMFNSLILADWTAFFSARSYGVAPEGQPMVEDFKKRLG